MGIRLNKCMHSRFRSPFYFFNACAYSLEENQLLYKDVALQQKAKCIMVLRTTSGGHGSVCSQLMG